MSDTTTKDSTLGALDVDELSRAQAEAFSQMTSEQLEEDLARINQQIEDSLAKIDGHLTHYDTRLARLAALEQRTAPAPLSAETYADGYLMSPQEVKECFADIETRLARLAELEKDIATSTQESRAPNTAGLETSALDVSKLMHHYYDGQLEEALRDRRVFLIEHPFKRAPRFWTRVKRAALPIAASVALGGLLGYCAFSDDEPEEPQREIVTNQLSYDAAHAHIQSAASLGESRALRQRIEQQTSAFDALPAERENVSPPYSTISMATPEEAIAQYNAFLESVGGELIVSVHQYRAFAESLGANVTAAGICRVALGELYRAMAFRETDALGEQQFADDLSFRCIDVDIESGHYRFVSYDREAPQTGENQ